MLGCKEIRIMTRAGLVPLDNLPQKRESILEIWADSFKEGEWFLDNLSKRFYSGRVAVRYAHNFLPIYELDGGGPRHFDAVVYGDYRGWENLPSKISDQLQYGKPDIFLYDRSDEKILLAIEETAAVPTCNQSMQRLERVWYAAKSKIPFVYLITEYGLHINGSLRRTSIWPAYLSIKLSGQYGVPSLTMLYGSSESPEEYQAGTGVDVLSRLADLSIRGWLGENIQSEKKDLLRRIYGDMATFVLSEYKAISSHLPATDILSHPEFVKFLVDRVAT